MNGYALVGALVVLVGLVGGLLAKKVLTPITKAVEEEELGQTRQGEYYDGD